MATINQPLLNGNAFTFSFYGTVKEDLMSDAACPLSTLPSELLSEVALHLDSAVDVGKMRLVNKRFCSAVHQVFLKSIIDDRTVYPRYACFRDFLSLLGVNYSMGVHVRKITLVAEGLREPEHGYSWAWEDVENQEGGLDFNQNDVAIINKINHHHVADVAASDIFINGGSYRTMLALLLSRLPKLETIEVRKLKPGEHVPGWAGPELLKELSFYKPDLNTNDIYYGDWKYDTVHKRVTAWVDEFGDEVLDDNAGPQASFRDDVTAAVETSRTKAKIAVVD